MKIAILSCFYPYRGGIAQFNASLYSQLEENNTVRAFNFKRQYPNFLFPGKTQYVSKDDEAIAIESTAILDTINPITWIKTINEIRKWKPQLIIIDYWMAWFAPSLGFIARRLKKDFKIISILHNVVAHEAHFYDKMLTKYFLTGFDGHIVLSEQVAGELLSVDKKAKYIELFHPIYSHFGKKLDRADAEQQLGLLPNKKNLLFFGLIREYKGLDILLEAFNKLDDSYQLIIAGEPYSSFEKYQKIIDKTKDKSRIHCFLNYIKDSEVKKFFSATDLTVLPYRSATQSGISAVSYHFEVPMLVTNVGGLKEAIGDRGIGLVADKVDADCIKQEIERFFSSEQIREQCRISLGGEKERLSWHNFVRLLEDFSDNLNV